MEQLYLDTLRRVMTEGDDVNDRTNTGCRSLFGVTMRHVLDSGFPALTTKRLAWRAVVGELLWFIEGSSDIDRLSELTHGVTGKHTISHDNGLPLPAHRRTRQSPTQLRHWTLRHCRAGCQPCPPKAPRQKTSPDCC